MCRRNTRSFNEGWPIAKRLPRGTTLIRVRFAEFWRTGVVSGKPPTGNSPPRQLNSSSPPIFSSRSKPSRSYHNDEPSRKSFSSWLPERTRGGSQAVICVSNSKVTPSDAFNQLGNDATAMTGIGARHG